MAADNKSLGKFRLDGIPPAPRGVPQIEVIFDIDADGILKVSATDKATNRSQHITIQASSGLSEEEVEKMRQEAEAYAEQDQNRRALVEARNAADSAEYSARRVLQQHGDHIPDEERVEIELKVDRLDQLKDSVELEEIRTTTRDLIDLIQGLDLNSAETGPAAGDERTIDGEIKEI